LQLLHQNIWLRYDGIDNDGNAIAKVFWAGAAHKGDDGLFYRAEVAWLRNLKDGSLLTITFKLNFDKVANDGRAVLFPLRTYTIKAIEEVVPIIDSVKGSSSNEDIPAGGQTVETTIILSGTATPDTKIDLANNGALMPNTEVQVDPLGEWTFRLTGLVAGNTYKLSARRKDGILSDARDVVVVALVVPTLDNVLDDRNEVVLEGTITVSTDLILKGTASLGQQINIRDGSGSGSATRGTATANLTTGIWECPITVPLGVRRLYAEACYPSNPLYSNVRNLTVTADVIPSITSATDLLEQNIPNEGFTTALNITLNGIASKGQRVDIQDGGTSKEKIIANALTGQWSYQLTTLAIGPHNFKAIALYGKKDESPEYKLTVVIPQVVDFTDFENSNWNGWIGSDIPKTYAIYTHANLNLSLRYWPLDGSIRTGSMIYKVFSNLLVGARYRLSLGMNFLPGTPPAKAIFSLSKGDKSFADLEFKGFSQWHDYSGVFLAEQSSAELRINNDIAHLERGGRWHFNDIKLEII
jgi:hypothetical protein